MKFTINKQELLKSINIVGKIIPPKSINPVLTNIKIVLDQDGLKFTGTDGTISIVNKIPFYDSDNAELIRDAVIGGVLVNNRILSDIVRKINGAFITFEVLEDNVAVIQNERSNFKLNCTPIDEFPTIDFETSGVCVELPANDFVEAINEVAFAASNKDTRLILTAINVEGAGERISFVATDGGRLAKKEIATDHVERFNANIPAKTLMEVVKSISGENDIKFFIEDRKIIFELNNTLISSSLILGDYPNTKNIIPSIANFNYTLTVNSEEFLQALDRVNIFSAGNDRENVVKLTMMENRVIVSCKSIQVGTSEDSLDIFKYVGNRLEISFNSDYVISAIRALKSEDVILRFLGEMKPFRISKDDDESVVQLITPVRTF